MLASTVQFSSNDQPPITRTLRSGSLGPASQKGEQRSHPQIPNSVPGTIRSDSRSTPKQY
jgi:hypothetical protein